MALKIATFVMQKDGTGEGRVYKLSPPLKPYPEQDEQGNEIEQEGFEYVWVSAAIGPMGGGPETYIFGCDKDGEVISWGELPGSRKGTLDIKLVLAEAGYKMQR